MKTNVSGSVAFTGWTLDDSAVEHVKIYYLGSGNPVYVGTANFVEGARPDVQQAYPLYPNASRAGWGYMLLTHFLPNQGNGTFTFHAVATDISWSIDPDVWEAARKELADIIHLSRESLHVARGPY